MITYLSAANIECQPGDGQYFSVELVVPVVCRHDRGGHNFDISDPALNQGGKSEFLKR